MKTGNQLELYYYQIATRGIGFKESTGEKYSRKVDNSQLTIS